MKKQCFSRERSQSNSFLKICLGRLAHILDASFIVINNIRVAVEKAKASRTHLFPYEAATPNLVPWPSVAMRSKVDLEVSRESSTCSRVTGAKSAL